MLILFTFLLYFFSLFNLHSTYILWLRYSQQKLKLKSSHVPRKLTGIIPPVFERNDEKRVQYDSNQFPVEEFFRGL